MLFAFPNNQEPELQLGTVPFHLSRFSLDFSQCIYKKLAEGELLSQWIVGSDFSFWVHYFFVQQPIRIHPYTKDDVLALHFLRKGRIQCDLKGYGPVVLEPGTASVFYVPGGVRHDAFLAEDFYCSVEIDFSISQLVTVAEHYPAFQPLLSYAAHGLRKGWHHGSSVVSQQVEDIIDSILSSRLNPASRAFFLEARVRDLFSWYIQDQADQQAWSDKSDRHAERMVERTIHFMEQHLDEKLSVRQLASHLNVGSSLLQEIFQKHLGKSVHAVLNEKRMQKAAFLLVTTGKPVSSIAVAVTSISIPSFCTAFKKFYGMTPTEYRKYCGENPNK